MSNVPVISRDGLDVGATIAISRSISRPWWAFWRRTLVTEFHCISGFEGPVVHFTDGGSIILPIATMPGAVYRRI